MKKIVVTTILATLFFWTYSQTPDFEWIVNGGSPIEHGNASSVVIDKWGNSYVAGNIDGQALIGNTLIEDSGFLAKYAPNGDVLWAKAGGQALLAVDTVGFLYGYAVGGITKYDTSGNDNLVRRNQHNPIFG